MSRVKEMAVVL